MTYRIVLEEYRPRASQIYGYLSLQSSDGVVVEKVQAIDRKEDAWSRYPLRKEDRNNPSEYLHIDSLYSYGPISSYPPIKQYTVSMHSTVLVD
jgi:hypothetical protein